MLIIARDGREDRLVRTCLQFRQPNERRVRDAVLYVGQRLVVAEQSLRERVVRWIGRRRGDARKATPVVDEIDQTPIGDGRYGQLRYGPQGLLIIQRRAQERSGLYEQPLAALDVPPFSDVGDDRLHGWPTL